MEVATESVKKLPVEFCPEKLQLEEFYHLMFAPGRSVPVPVKYMIEGQIWELYDYGIIGLYELDSNITQQSHGMYQVEYIQYMIWKYGDRIQNDTKIMVGKFRRAES